MPSPVRRFLPLPLAALLSGPSLAQVIPPDAPAYLLTAPGADFVQVSWTTRTAIVGQQDPFTLTMPPLPPGAVEVKSFASWNYIADGTSFTDAIVINGTAVVGARYSSMTPALCSGKAWLAMHRADVTGLLNLGGGNTIDGVCDKPYGGDDHARGGGITLLTVYGFALGPDRTVSVYHPAVNTAQAAGGDVLRGLILPSPYQYFDVHFFVNALGGSPGASDGFKLNGTSVAGALPGTSATSDAWIGLLGPQADDNFYDAGEGEISAWMTAGDDAVDVETVTGTDCIAHTFAVLSFQTECGDVVTYCTSKVNSLGCTPIVSTTGKPSASSGQPFKVRASSFRNKKNGLLFYGLAKIEAPFQGGWLCVKPPIKRTSVQSSGGNVGTDDCSGTYSYDFNALIAAGTDANLVPGGIVYAQYWSRDPDDAFTTSMSDAVGFDICP